MFFALLDDGTGGEDLMRGLGISLISQRGLGGSSFVFGTKTNVDTGTVAIGSDTDVLSSVLVQSDPGNTGHLLLGDTGAQTMRLLPGETFEIPAGSVSYVEVKAFTSETDMTVNYMGVVR